ncbi:MAG: outer membrane protein [Alphaproteobacteria bacterium]
MKKILTAAVGLAALAGQAQAADLSRTRTAMPSVIAAPVSLWTGFYLGGHAGYAFSGRFDTNSPVFGLPPGPGLRNLTNGNGFLGGVQAGYDWQFGAFVAGLAADYSWTEYDRRSPTTLGAAFPAVARSLGQGSVRGRFGFLATPDLLLYMTGGFAYGANSLAIDGFRTTRTATGWTIGGGAEYRITPNLSAFAEYRYTDLSGQVYAGIVGGPPGSPFVRMGVENHQVRIGVNYRFTTGPVAEPVVARY